MPLSLHRTFATSVLLVFCWSSALASAAEDWPCWRGPQSTGAQVDSSLQLVDDLSQAEIVWSSEWIPGAYYDGGSRGPNPAGLGLQGGHGSPIVIDGRVYCYYWLPNLKHQDPEWVARTEDRGSKEMRKILSKAAGVGLEGEALETRLKRKCSLLADDVVICLDARSGATLWKQRWEDANFNYMPGKHFGPSSKGRSQPTMCGDGERVFAVSPWGRIYALDAVSGEQIWEARLDRYDEFLAKQQNAVAKSTLKANIGNALTQSPCLAGGLLVVGTGGGLVAYDAASGRRAWATEVATHDNCSPLRWRHDGRDFIIAGRTCVALDGRVLWTLEDAGITSHTVAVDEHHLAISGRAEKGEGTGIQVYRIAPQGGERLWASKEYDAASHCSPVIYRDRVYSKVDGTRRGQNRMACFDLESGEVLAITEDFRHDGCGSLIACDGKIFYDLGWWADAEPERFSKPDEITAWSPEPVYYASSTTPAYVGGALFVRSNLHGIVCLDVRSGASKR